MTDLNSYNILSEPPDKTNSSSGGIHWEYNYHDNTLHVYGTATSTSLNNYIDVSGDLLLTKFDLGKIYYVTYEDITNKVQARVLVATQSNPTVTNIFASYSDGTFTLPEDTTRIIIRLAVSSGTSNVDTTVKLLVSKSKSNKELTTNIQGLNAAVDDNWKRYILRNYLEYASIHRTNLAFVGSVVYPGWSGTSSGITFTFNSDYSIHVSGTATSTAIWRFATQPTNGISYKDIIPEWFKPGKVLKLDYSSDNVEFRLNIYSKEDDSTLYPIFNTKGIGMKVVPEFDPTTMYISPRLAVASGTTVDEIVYPILTEISSDYVEDKLLNQNIDHRISPILPYLSRATYGSFVIDSSNKTFVPNYDNNAPIRISVDLTGIEPCNIRMIDNRYVFRFYWFETTNNDVHSTAWGNSWNIPESYVSCMMTIKKVGSEDIPFTLDDTHLLNIVAESSTIKSWYQSEIFNVAKRVQQSNTSPGLVFLLSTDQHYNSVQGTQTIHDTITDMTLNQKELLKYITVDGVISLGDVADFKVGTETKFQEYGVLDLSYNNLDSIFYNWMNYAVNKLASVHPNFLYVPGNHDDNRYINKDNLHESVSAYDYTPEEMYSYYVSRGKDCRVYNLENNGLDYYIDYSSYKLRVFFVDSNHYYGSNDISPHGYSNCWWYGWQDSTVTWFRQQLNATPTDYSVIMFTHMSVVKENNADNTNYINQVNMYNVIQEFISNGGNFIAELYGHSHVDWSTTTPWLSISFDCQKSYNYTPNFTNMPGAIHNLRTAYTATEDCWNVVIIQPASRKIKVIRFGAGDDAEYSY